MGITFLSVMPKDPKQIKEVREAIREHFLALGGGGGGGTGFGALLGRLRGAGPEKPAATQPVKKEQ
jgi:hypothetical protein